MNRFSILSYAFPASVDNMIFPLYLVDTVGYTDQFRMSKQLCKPGINST